MNKALRKLHTQRGETLVETLVAILVCVFSVTLLGTMVSATFHINLAAAAATERYQTELKAAELQMPSDVLSGAAIAGPETVRIHVSGAAVESGTPFHVTWYGSQTGTLRSFSRTVD